MQERVGKFLDSAFPRGTPTNRTVVTNLGGKIVTDKEILAIRKTPVMWGIPCDEISFTMFWTTFEKHANRMPWDGWASSEGTYLPKARNMIHDGFLNSSEPYLMMLDSDILFPKNIVEQLMSYNLPIVGGWYKDKKSDDKHPVVYDFLSEDEKGVCFWQHRAGPGKGLEKVDAMGAGCWLMRRDVAEALGESPYNLNGGGEDMKISRDLMKLGIPLTVDWDMPLAHVGVGFY